MKLYNEFKDTRIAVVVAKNTIKEKNEAVEKSIRLFKKNDLVVKRHERGYSFGRIAEIENITPSAAYGRYKNGMLENNKMLAQG